MTYWGLVRKRYTIALAIVSLTPLSAQASNDAGDLFFSTFRVANPFSQQVYHDATIQKVHYTYDGTTFSIGTPALVADLGANGNADGLIFATNGNLLIGGSTTGNIEQITTAGAVVGSVAVGTSNPYHLTLSLDGKTIYSGGSTSLFQGGDTPGPLGVTPFFSAGTVHSVSGSVTGLTQLAFTPNGNAFYTSSPDTGTGSFGTINLGTFATSQAIGGLAAAHGIVYDSFSGDFLLSGANHITQIDPASMKVVSDLALPANLNLQLDQVSVDGQGHIFVGDNGNVDIFSGTGTPGKLVFVDYSKTKLVGDAGNVVATPSLALALDDLAPLSGLVSWTKANGDWSSASNWLPTAVPNAQLAAFFGTGSTMPYTVTLTGPSSANNLTVQGDNVTLALGGNTLSIGGTLTVDGSGARIGSLALSGGGTVSAGGGATITASGILHGYGNLQQASTGATLANGGVVSADVATQKLVLNLSNAANAGTLQAINGSELELNGMKVTQSATGKVIANAGTVAFTVGASLQGGGSIEIASGGRVTFAAVGAVVSNAVASLTITGNGALDIGNDSLAIHYGNNADPNSTIAALILAGKTKQSGIFSTSAASNDVVGYADDPTNKTELIATTLFGDINLDGKVNNSDYFQFNKSFGKSMGQPGYNPQFDFNGDGKVNNTDYFQFNKNFGMVFMPKALAITGAGPSGPVPEPATAGLLALAGACTLLRRRRI